MHYIGGTPVGVNLIELALKRDDPRFKLHAYLCDGPCIRPREDMGTMTFTQVFVMRPDGCRYAVIEAVAEPDKFLVVDLYETTYDDRTVYMGPLLTFPTLDAALMSRMLNYDNGL